MRIIENRKIYQCEHCGKVSLNAGALSQHEKKCHENPKNKPQCWEWCKHYTKTDEKQEVEKAPGLTSKVPIRKCDAKKCCLFTPLCSEWKKEELRNIDEVNWEQMPSIVEGCEHFGNPDLDFDFTAFGGY